MVTSFDLMAIPPPSITTMLSLHFKRDRLLASLILWKRPYGIWLCWWPSAQVSRFFRGSSAHHGRPGGAHRLGLGSFADDDEAHRLLDLVREARLGSLSPNHLTALRRSCACAPLTVGTRRGDGHPWRLPIFVVRAAQTLIVPPAGAPAVAAAHGPHRPLLLRWLPTRPPPPPLRPIAAAPSLSEAPWIVSC
jgi:hypothetical protein